MPLPIKDVAPVPKWIHGDGSANRAFRIAILAEGFLASELPSFRTACQKVLDSLLATPSFARRRDRFAVLRIDCNSLESATVLRPKQVPPGIYLGRTPFDVWFDLLVGRGLNGDTKAVDDVIASIPGLPKFDSKLVLVNNLEHAGEAPGHHAFLTLGPGYDRTFIHELGHAGFGLGDEYEYKTGEPNEPVLTFSGGPEPLQPNITSKTSRADIPWGRFIAATTPLPTTKPSPPNECARNKRIQDFVPTTVVGLFEGAYQISCGLYRPAMTCMMRREADAMCPVCDEAIDRRLMGTIVAAKPLVSIKAEGWTHVVGLPFLLGRDSHAACYNMISGIVGFHNLDEMIWNPTPPNVAYDKYALEIGHNCATSFAEGDEAYLVLSNSFTSGRIFYAVRPESASPPEVLQVYQEPPTGLPGYSHVAPVRLNGTPHLLSYGRILGDLMLEAIDFVQGLPRPRIIGASPAGTLMPWHQSLSGITTVDMDGDTYLIGIDAAPGIVQVGRLAGPQGANLVSDTWTSPAKFLREFVTHVQGFIYRGRVMVAMHSTINGSTTLFEVRSGGTAIDFLVSVPGFPGASSWYDVGMPALGVFTRQGAEYLWNYNTALSYFQLATLV